MGAVGAREPYRSAVAVITATLAVMMGVRGWDYAAGDSAHVARNLTSALDFLPLHVWGALFLASSALSAIGLVMRCASCRWVPWPRVLVASHILAVTLYATLGYSIAEVAATRSFDGVRNAVILLGVAVIHAVLAMTEAAADRQRTRRG